MKQCDREVGDMTDNNDEKGFTVKDRRTFAEDGEIRSESSRNENEKAEEAKEASSNAESDARRQAECGTENATPLPEINFASFILSLHTSALFHFGDLKDPATKKTMRNLPAAKQTIDLIRLLQDKTRGNLDEYEQKIIEEVLFELRMRYVKESKQK